MDSDDIAANQTYYCYSVLVDVFEGELVRDTLEPYNISMTSQYLLMCFGLPYDHCLRLKYGFDLFLSNMWVCLTFCFFTMALKSLYVIFSDLLLFLMLLC